VGGGEQGLDPGVAGQAALAGQGAGEGQAVGQRAPAGRRGPAGGEGEEAAGELLAQLGGQHRPGPGDLAGPFAGERGRGRPDPVRVEPARDRVEPARDRAAPDQRPDQGRLPGGEPLPFPAHRRVAAAAMASSSAASSASGG